MAQNFRKLANKYTVAIKPTFIQKKIIHTFELLTDVKLKLRQCLYGFADFIQRVELTKKRRLSKTTKTKHNYAIKRDISELKPEIVCNLSCVA